MMTEYELIRSSRRTIAVEIKGGRVIVRAPLRMSKVEIEKFISSKADWINKHLEVAKQRQSVSVHPFSVIVDGKEIFISRKINDVNAGDIVHITVRSPLHYGIREWSY